MATEDEQLHVVFNGEIYNYPELRTQLINQGVRLRSHCDTEALLHLYRLYGQDMLPRLRGMFAFAIWDTAKRGMFLATDTFGIKPLFYALEGNTFRFASQVKALLASNEVDSSPDPAGHVGFLLLGSVPEPHTLYRGIRGAGAGTAMWVGADGCFRTWKWTDLAADLAASSENPVQLPHEERSALFRQTLLDSVKHHLLADVPVAVFLSAGLDSATLAGLAVEAQTAPVSTVTLAFDEYRGTEQDEAPLAAKVAGHYHTTHTTSYVRRDDFRQELDYLLSSMDQPTIDGINTYFVSRAAASRGFKVALSGLGGDELLGGYPSFSQVPRLAGLVGALPGHRQLGKGFRLLSGALFKARMKPKMAGLLEFGGTYHEAYLLRRGLFMPWELPQVLDPELARSGLSELNIIERLGKTIEGNRSDHLRVAALEACWYMQNQLLRDTDWAGMAHSLEIRVPLVDAEVWRTLAPIVGSGPDFRLGKKDLAQAVRPPLPEAVVQRKKTGFTVPLRDWLTDADRRYDTQAGFRPWALELYKAFVTK